MPANTPEVKIESGLRYYVGEDGKRYDSVTTVLETILRKRGLEVWRGNLGNELADQVAKEAQDIGTHVHAVVSSINEQLDAELLPEVKNIETFPDLERQLVTAYLGWAPSHIARFVRIEQPVFSRKFLYAGTPDAIVILKHVELPYILEIKVTATVYINHWLQLAAYAEAAVEMGLITRPYRVAVVRLDKEDTENVKLIPRKTRFTEEQTADFDFNAFLNCLNLFRWAKGMNNE